MTAAKTLPSLRLRDPRDLYASPGRMPTRIDAELARGGSALETSPWHAAFLPGHRDPASYDHLVVADDPREGTPLALLGADVLATEEEHFLMIETVFVAPVVRGRRVLRRMLATALLQAARQGPVPRVIATRTMNPVFYRALRRFGRDLATPLYPSPDPALATLRTAALARRVARRTSPQCRFEPGTGALRGAVVAHGMQGVVQPTAAGDAAIDAMFAAHLGSADHFLLVLDLRGLSAAAILEAARRIRRRR